MELVRTSRNREKFAKELRFVGGPAAPLFLLNPALNVGRDVLDWDIPGPCTTKEHHGFSIHEGDVHQVESHGLGCGTLGNECAFELRNVLARELTAQR